MRGQSFLLLGIVLILRFQSSTAPKSRCYERRYLQCRSNDEFQFSTAPKSHCYSVLPRLACQAMREDILRGARKVCIFCSFCCISETSIYHQRASQAMRGAVLRKSTAKPLAKTILAVLNLFLLVVCQSQFYNNPGKTVVFLSVFQV